jgi:hypothetical protein
MVPVSDSEYIFAVRYTIENDRFTILMKINLWGDTIWTKKIDLSVHMGVYPYELIRTRDGGFALCGSYWDRGCLQKLDSNFNTQWYQEFGPTGVYDHSFVSSVDALPDGGFVIGYITNSNPYSEGFVCRLDSAGNILWKRDISGYWKKDFIRVKLMPDSNILAVSTHVVDYHDPYQKNVEIKVWKLNGYQVKANYPGPGEYIYLHHLDQLTDSTYIVSGYNWDEQWSWWMIISNKTRKILYKDFSYPYEYRKFYASIGTPDNGILSIGENQNSSRKDRDPWILKTDIYGCLTPGCDPYGIYIVSQPISKDICTDDITTFVVLANDDTTTVVPRFNRKWQRKSGNNWISLNDDNNFQGVTTDTLKVINAHGMDSIYYLRCLIWNEKYYLATKTATLTVTKDLHITKHPANQYVKIMEPAFFRVVAEGEEPISYQWYFNEQEIPGETRNVYLRYPVSYKDQDIPINCRIKNPCDELLSESAYVIISSTGFSSQADKIAIRIYTIPSLNLICINIPSSQSEIRKYTLFDFAGKIILTNQSESQETFIPTDRLSKGLYILKIDFRLTSTYRKIIIE